MDWKELKDKITGPGDLAAFLLGFTAGFAVDAILFPVGVPPGTVGGVAGTGALGAKKAWDAARARNRDLRGQAQLADAVGKRIDWLRRLPNLPPDLKKGLDFVEDGWRAGALTRDEVVQHLDKILAKYRETSGPGFPI